MSLTFAPPQPVLVSKTTNLVLRDLLGHVIEETDRGLICEKTDDAAQRTFPRLDRDSARGLYLDGLRALQYAQIITAQGAGLFFYVPLRFEIIEQVV